MPRERDFSAQSEDADYGIPLSGRWLDERRLRVVQLACNGHHLVIAQILSLRENAQRVTFQRIRREDVHLDEVERFGGRPLGLGPARAG
jgi:hypothetical protein